MKSKYEQCADCAFKEGGAANKEVYNRLRGTVCALGGVPFFCHHDIDWESQHSWTAAQKKKMCRRSGICAGWTVRVNDLRQKGYYDQFRVIRHAVAEQCLLAIDLMIDAKGKTKRKMSRLLRRMIRVLASRNVGNKKIPLLWG